MSTLKFPSIPSKRLSESITASASSFKVSDILGWDGADLTSAEFGTIVYVVFRNSTNTAMEIMEIDPATIASASITITRRGLKFDGTLLTEVTANKLTWVKGDTIVEFGTNAPQMFQWLKEYIDDASIAGAVNATSSVRGIVEVATSAEIDADTALGATGASIGVTPDQLVLSKYGTRLPSAIQKDALVGFGTVGTANKYITESYLTGFINAYAGSSAPTGWLMCDGSAVSRTTYATLFALISTTYGVGDGSTTFNVPNLKGRMPIGAGTAATKILTFSSRSSDDITITGAANNDTNEVQTGQAVLYTAASGAMTGLTHNTTYYMIRVSALVFKLASSRANAVAGTAISLSSNGTGTQTFTITLTARTLADTGGHERHSLTTAELAAHTHTSNAVQSSGSAGAGTAGNSSYGAATIDSTGGSGDHTVMNPFLAINYIIKF